MHGIQLSKRGLLFKIKITYVGEKWGRFKGNCEAQFLETPAEPGRCSMAKMDIIMRAERVREDIVISMSSLTQTVEQFKDIASTVYQ